MEKIIVIIWATCSVLNLIITNKINSSLIEKKLTKAEKLVAIQVITQPIELLGLIYILCWIPKNGILSEIGLTGYISLSVCAIMFKVFSFEDFKMAAKKTWIRNMHIQNTGSSCDLNVEYEPISTNASYVRVGSWIYDVTPARTECDTISTNNHMQND